MTITEILAKCDLQHPDVWAAKPWRERFPFAMYPPASEEEGSGRTTRLFLQVLAAASDGKSVFFFTPNKEHKVRFEYLAKRCGVSTQNVTFGFYIPQSVFDFEVSDHSVFEDQRGWQNVQFDEAFPIVA